MVKESISRGLNNLWDKLGEVGSNIVTGLTNAKDAIVTGLTTVKDWIGEKVQAVKDAVVGLVDRFKEMMSNLFHKLFVPDGNVFQEKTDELKKTFDERLPIVDQLSDAYQRVTSIISGSGVRRTYARGHQFTPPTFTIHWYGKDYNLIDLSLFDEYMPFVRGLIAGFAWFFFITRYYKKIADLIMVNGDSGGGATK